MSIIEKALEKLGGDYKPSIPAPKDAAQDANRPVYQEPMSRSGTTVEPLLGVHGEHLKNGARRYLIDWEHLKQKGMLVPEMARSQLAEEYRLIKRPLLMNAFPEGDNGIERANLILITSSVPGEGKTFTAVNLALSIAMERDRTVLLVDADVAKPSISRLLGIEEETGLIDVLEGKNVRLADVLLKTDIPNLTLLPAGRLHQHSTELLASQAMKNLANELSSRYPDRIVIFDSPPLLAASQGSVLSDLVGQIVLVVESDATPQYIVKETASKIGTNKVVGCVLNKTKKGFGFTYYGYGYGYGYGYYGQQKAQDA